MSSETFESLEDEFRLIKNGLNSKLDESLPKLTLPKLTGQANLEREIQWELDVLQRIEREIQRGLDNLQRIVDELEVEARRAPYPYRNQLNNRLKAYKQDLNTFKKKVTQSESNFSSSQLMATSNPQTSSYSGAVINRGRLLQMSETIDRTTQSVNRTQQIAAETDEVGIAVVDELGTQREALIRTKERLVDTDENLSRSRKILRSMHRRVMTNKLILIVIIILEIAILCGIVYYKFFR